MKRKIKTFLLSIVVTELLIGIVFALATVDIQTRGVAGYMGDSIVTVFSDNTQKKITELTEEVKEKSNSFSDVIVQGCKMTKGIFNLFLLLFE